MRSKTNKYNAKRVVLHGIKFDSIYESQVYEKLCSLVNKAFISPHARAAYLGNDTLNSRELCISNTSWRVDFLVRRKTDTRVFALEAKGRFLQSDKFKFLLWQLYQDIPLLVVHLNDKKPRGFHSSGLVHFISWRHFSLMSQVDLVELLQLIRDRSR
ncbi:DUF1064 domain-containing protein [Okeania sp. SIO2B3]|uniref:DUF1064 domain-containing protein n=1 Tax=Okeania sp. SIO2B3 TaxID=2607784 RepID=UPI0013C1EC46|nr:DUF1064 domain-containing protein [Okeania sp. SIO2B3]NET40607.1 DUF1064 domain-containing protein [Okeania sp. SIO2B3]